MKINNFLVVLLVILGCSVGVMSLYMASLSGVMGKMGLVGGDFSQAIRVNELARQVMAQKEEGKCNVLEVAKKVPGYLFSKGEERVVLSGELGGQRIICGIKHVLAGNVERGVYTIMKGLRYLKGHYTELRILVEGDSSKCELLTSPVYERWVEGYLLSSEGRVHEVVLEVYNQVEASRGRVEELCTE